MQSLQGAVRTHVKRLEVDVEAGHFEMEVTWHDSAEADEQRLALGPATHPVCWTMVGYASGAGDSMQWLTGIEFHRQRFLKHPRRDTAAALRAASGSTAD